MSAADVDVRVRSGESLRCSFCNNSEHLVLARNGVQICASCVDRAHETLHAPEYAHPYDGIAGGMLEAIAIAARRRLSLVSSRRKP